MEKIIKKMIMIIVSKHKSMSALYKNLGLNMFFVTLKI